MKIIATGFFSVNLAYVGRDPIHTHSAVASFSCLAKSSRHQVMTVQLHRGQDSSALKASCSSDESCVSSPDAASYPHLLLC